MTTPHHRQLEKLCKQANLQVSVRSRYAHRLKWITVAIDVGILLSSFLLAVLTFADPLKLEILTRLSVGTIEAAGMVMAILNFIAVLLVLYFRPADMARTQSKARRHYTAVYKEMDRLRKNEHVSERAVKSLEQRFIDDPVFPGVPDKLFLRYKRWHYRKIRLSKEAEQA